MKKIVIAGCFMILSGVVTAGESGSRENSSFGIECVRWSADARQISCGTHPWRRDEPAEMTFGSIKEIYARGFKVVTMYDIAGTYGRTVIVIEKR